MSAQSGRKIKQQKSAFSLLTHQPAEELIFSRAIILPFLMLLALVIMVSPTIAASDAALLDQPQNKPTSIDGGSYRVAEISEWQRNAFRAIDIQKRLDKLAREKSEQTSKTKKPQKSTRKRKLHKRLKPQNALAKIRKRHQVLARNGKSNTNIVYEPAKLQSCLKVAGYFKGAMTGRLDDATLKAYLVFREDKKMQHRPNNLYDTVIQKTLFGLCPDENIAQSSQVVASAKMPKSTTKKSQQQKTTPQKSTFVAASPKKSLGKKYTNKLSQLIGASDGPVTTASIGVTKKMARVLIVAKSKPLKTSKSMMKQTVVKTRSVQQGRIAAKDSVLAKVKTEKKLKSPREEMVAQKTFANDVLAATDNSGGQIPSGLKVKKLARLGAGSSTGASSSFAVTGAASNTSSRWLSSSSMRVASASSVSSSPFLKSLSISDLANAQAVNPNTCSPQKHAPVASMSTVPVMSTPRQAYPMRTASAYSYMNDDGPLITGSISPSSSSASSSRNPIVKSFKNRVRLVQTDQPQKACLPEDLYNMLATAHGRKSGVSVCKSDCLPAPKTFSQGQKELFAEQYNISWCGIGCLGIADPLPLAELLKIEREARVNACMNPQLSLSPAAKLGKGGSVQRTAITDMYATLPGGYGNADNIAVLIGNKNYGKNISTNEAALANIAAMRALLIDQLGYSKDNVLVLRDAKRSDMERLFGRRGDVSGELQKRLKANPDAQLMVYYSGHASTSGLGLNNYLLSVDAVIGREDTSAYSLSVLYDNLRELDARTTQLFLETSFNADRSSKIQAPNISERRVNAAPIVPVRGLAVYTSASGDQKSLIDHETGIGLFTRYLISGLAGGADQRPIGNGDRIIDSVELYVHLAGNVRLAARKTLGLRQNPTFSRSDNLFLSQLSRKPRK